jgi:hypothetical protein
MPDIWGGKIMTPYSVSRCGGGAASLLYPHYEPSSQVYSICYLSLLKRKYSQLITIYNSSTRSGYILKCECTDFHNIAMLLLYSALYLSTL